MHKLSIRTTESFAESLIDSIGDDDTMIITTVWNTADKSSVTTIIEGPDQDAIKKLLSLLEKRFPCVVYTWG